MWRHTVLHTGGRGPTQDVATLLADYRRVTGRPASPDDWPVHVRVQTPPFPRTIDEGIAHIDHYEQADAIRAARLGGVDARIVTRQGTISGEFELIIQRGRIVSVNWCKPGTPPRGAPVCQIRAVRGDVSLSISYDPRGSPGTDEMIAFAVEFANRFIVAGPPIPVDETEWAQWSGRDVMSRSSPAIPPRRPRGAPAIGRPEKPGVVPMAGCAGMAALPALG
jgi:hypothetical protein